MMKSLKLTMFMVAAVAGGGMLAGASMAGPNDGAVAKSPTGKESELRFGSAELRAVIVADGTIARSHGANAATTGKISGLGAYKVGFFRNVRGCAYVATLGGSFNFGTPPTGQIVVEGRFDNVNGVFVQTTDSTGAAADRGFHLFVTC